MSASWDKWRQIADPNDVRNPDESASYSASSSAPSPLPIIEGEIVRQNSIDGCEKVVVSAAK